jgi:diguanylate cyclase (GGDEF)-like protein/PAS domain S-box-containing protein
MGDARNTLRSATDPAAASRRRAVLASFESIPDPVVVIDRHERIAFVNRHVVHRFGFATAELVDQPFDLLVPGEQRGRRWDSLTEVLSSSCPTAAGLEASARCKDGRLRALSIDVGLLELDGAVFAVCMLRDAPEERAVASAAAQALGEAQRIAKLGIWTWDPLANHHWWSDDLYRMLQIDRAEGRPFERYIAMVHPDDRDRINGNAAKIAEGDEIEPFDVRLVLPDGTPKIFHSRGAASFDSTGRPVQLRGTIQDVTEQRATETALRLSDMRYREAQRLAKIGNWEWDLTTNTSWWSDELYSILEEDPRSYASTFDNFIAKIHPDDRQVLIDNQGNVAGASYAPTESRVVLPDGREKRIEQLVQPRLDATGRPVAIVGTVHDVTERRALESKLRESEARYASTVELAAVGIAHVAADGRFIWCNSRFREMLGYDNDELMARTIRDVSHPADVGNTDGDRARLHEGVISTLTIEKRYVRKDGATIWVRITGAPRRAPDDSLLYDVAIVEDITVRKAAEDRVQYLATHDELTGLPNRTLFGELLQGAIDAAWRLDRHCAVLFIDLDRFKIVNDSLGHEAGDLLLKEVALRLRRCVRDEDAVARLGGDEFVVLLAGISSVESAAETAKRVLASLHTPIKIRNQECRVTGSIGIAVYPDDARDATALMKHADMAMYLAKDEGKNNFQFYSADMAPMSVEHLELEVRLAQALQRGEFSLQYQPRFDIVSGRILGAEALLRWWNADLGTVSPAQFIPLAEDTGLIVAIGQWVLRTACEQNMAWRKRGMRSVVMSVNISPRQFKEPSLLGDIAGVLKDTGMPAELLELEITESMLMQHVDIAAEKAAAMKSLGIRLAIDDFGTGYSSLSQLKRFPIDTLKIDRAFVRDIPSSVDDTAITKAVISLGKALGVRVVAEGVESAEQYRFLRDHGCDEMQGFLFSKPCHPDAFAELLKNPPETDFEEGAEAQTASSV